jgi:hypothetical protein
MTQSRFYLFTEKFIRCFSLRFGTIIKSNLLSDMYFPGKVSMVRWSDLRSA